MAKCDEGYLCEVCHKDVSSIVDSDLYLRYVIGQLPPEQLHVQPDRHLRCNPVLSQFIDDARFAPVSVQGAFDRRELDADHVAEQVQRVSRGYRRLWQIVEQAISDVTAYPLPEVIDRYR